MSPPAEPSEPTPLFRPEAVQHAKGSVHGRVVLARPLSFAVLAGVFGGLGLAIVLFLAFVGVSRSARLAGVVLPAAGATRIAAPQAGLVLHRHVSEGQPVRQGDALFVVSSERTTSREASVDGAVTQLLKRRQDSLALEQQILRQQTGTRVASLDQRARDLGVELQRIDEQIALQSQRVKLADEALKRYTDLWRAEFVSATQVQDRTAEVLEQRQKLMDLERTRASTERSLADARAEMRNLDFQSHREFEAAGRDAAEVAQAIAESEARREVLVKAPVSGTVTGITVEEGHPVQVGQAMATLLQAGAPLEAELYAPSRAVGFIKPGMRAMIRHQAFAYQKFGQHAGTVREVSGIALRPEELPLHAGSTAARSDGEPLYRVRITLDRQDVLAYGEYRPLKAGMALEASVVLEERKLYEWILAPLFSVSGRWAR